MDPAHGHAAAPVAEPPHEAPATPGAARLDFVRTEARRMAFDQALLLLERALGADAFRAGRLRVRARSNPAFPASDVERVEEADGAVTAEVTFMGLYGATAALPRYFTEPIAHEQADGLRAFLDLFGGRIYRLYHDAWRKYRPRVGFGAGDAAEAPGAVPFVALAGIPPGEGAAGLPVAPLRLAALAGRLGTRVRNAAGLRDLLAHFLGVPVAVEENHPRWVTTPSRGRLGARADAGVRLGQGALLGARVYDVSGKARVVFGPLGIEDFRALLPGGTLAAVAAGLTRFYLPDGLDFDVELRLRAAQTHPLVLGERLSRLGRNAWLGATSPGVVSEVITYN